METAVRMDLSQWAASVGIRAGAILFLAVWLLGTVGGCARDTTKYPEIRTRDGNVPVDLSGIRAESGRFQSYRSTSGRNVDIFVYRERSGAPHAVLDACRTCYRWKKGYVLDGREVVCLKCDMRFKLESLAQGTGSCVPVALTSELLGDSLIIPAAELEAGAEFF